MQIMKYKVLNKFLLTIYFVIFVKNYTVFCCHPVAVKKLYFGKITGFPTNEVTTVTADKKGNIYVGTEDSGIIVIKNNKIWTQIRKNQHGLTFDAIHKLYIDSFDNLWVCTASGLNLSKGGSISRKYFAIDGLKDNVCLSICEVENGSDMWVGTTKGLVHKTFSFSRLTDADGLPSNIVQSLSSDIQGNVWVGTSEGLAKLEFNNIRRIPLKASDDDTNHFPWIYDIESKKFYEQEYIRKITSSYDALISGLQKKKDTLINQNSDFTTQYEEAINIVKEAKNKFQEQLKNNIIYAATSNGLFSIDVDSLKSNLVADGWYTAIAAQPSGRIYAANKNLNVYPVNEISALFDSYNITDEIKTYVKTLISLAMDGSSNDPEIGSVSAYITELKNAGIKDFNEWLDGFLANKVVTDMIFAPSGDLWITIKGVGVFKFTPNFVNHDACIFALQGFLTEAECQNIKIPSNFKIGLNITSKSLISNDLYKEVTYAVQSYTYNFIKNIELWVGNWTELSEKECKFVAEFIGRYGVIACALNLARVLIENPVVAIPIGDISSLDVRDIQAR